MAFPPPQLLAQLADEATRSHPAIDGPAHARVIAATSRAQSATAILSIDGANGSIRAIAKAPFPDGGPDLADRPRLGLDAGFEDKHRFEWDALAAMWDEFSSGGDGLSAARPLLHDDAMGVLVLEHVSGPTLRTLLDQGDVDRAVEVAGRAGRWLRRFQSMTALAGLPVRRGTGNEIAAVLDRFVAFLDHPLARRLGDAAMPVVADASPEVGAGHGDFAPRNLIVGDDGLVVIDPLARWRVPVLEDAAYFTLELQLGGPPRLRRPDVAPLREAFLSGHGTPDDRNLAAVEALVLLDKWAAAKTAPVASSADRARRALRRRRIRAAARRLVRRLERSG